MPGTSELNIVQYSGVGTRRTAQPDGAYGTNPWESSKDEVRELRLDAPAVLKNKGRRVE